MFFRSLGLITACILVLASEGSFAQGKVLYVTHEPGRWHDYTAQRAAFTEVARDAGWELTVASGDKDELFEFLRSESFAAGQDAIVYNFCLADSRDMTAMQNLIAQTVDGGVPAFLVHCAMHSWWDSFKKGKPIPGNELGLARAHRKLLKQWQKQHPETSLPAWGDFTGIASTKHGPKEPIALIPSIEHPVSQNLPVDYATTPTELYDNHYITPDVQALVSGEQGGDKAVVMWLVPRGKSRVMGLTLGHDTGEWGDPVFRILLRDGVNYLLGRSDGPMQ